MKEISYVFSGNSAPCEHSKEKQLIALLLLPAGQSAIFSLALEGGSCKLSWWNAKA